MKDKNSIRRLKYLTFWVFLVLGVYSESEAFDFSDWDTLIKKHVRAKTIDGILINAVDYPSLKIDPLFSGLASRLSSYSLLSLESQKSKMTFWINVYNIFAAKMITDNYPIKSIKYAGSIFRSVWKQPAGILGGKKITLDEIEHKILRKMNDPRIHMAIVCASVSCPDLRLESYAVEKLNGQLDDQMRRFLRSREKGMKLDEMKNQVYLSSIFKWFKEDFDNRGGVLEYIGQYITAEEKKALSDSQMKINYMDYNWNINGY
jgi:hypothetical protein